LFEQNRQHRVHRNPDAQLRGLQPADPANALSFLCGNYYLTVYNFVTFE